MSLPEKLQLLADELAVFADAQERLSHLLDRARRSPPLPPAERTEAHRVHGCVSVVWVVPSFRDGLCRFNGDAESPLVRGLVVFLCDFFSDRTPAELAATDLDPLEFLHLARDLSPTRRNGLAAVRRSLLEFARARS